MKGKFFSILGYVIYMKYLITNVCFSFTSLMKNRSRYEVIAAILKSVGKEETRTKIMYKAFLSYAQLKEYLNLLIENGLIDYDSTGATYRTSPKGLKYLGLYSQMDELVLSARPTK